MKEQKTDLNTNYAVKKTDHPVSIRVMTGGINQTSVISAEVGNLLNIPEAYGSIPETIIGSNKELKGKRLLLTCIIADTSRDTNYTELKITLKGGSNPKASDFHLFTSVENEGDSVKYTCIISFI